MLVVVSEILLSALFGAYLVFRGHTKVEMKKETFSFDFGLFPKMVFCGFAFWIARMAMGLIGLVYNGRLGRYGGDTAISVYAVAASIMTFVIVPASGTAGQRYSGAVDFCGSCQE